MHLNPPIHLHNNKHSTVSDQSKQHHRNLPHFIAAGKALKARLKFLDLRFTITIIPEKHALVSTPREVSCDTGVFKQAADILTWQIFCQCLLTLKMFPINGAISPQYLLNYIF